MPAAWNLKAPASLGSGTAVAERLAAIEPAAGPGSALVVNRAADQGFYAPVLLDEIAVTMRLDPDAPASALTLDDARRLSGPGVAGNEVHVARMRLGGIAIGPLALPSPMPISAPQCSGPTCSPTWGRSGSTGRG